MPFKKNNRKIEIYDTTLRDGAQNPGVSFTTEDKLRIIAELDNFGMDYIEAGNPAANPKDAEVFLKAASLNLKNAKLVAFGSTCRVNANAERDENLNILNAVKTDYTAVFGKSSLLHVEKIIKTTGDENLRIIFDSIEFLSRTKKVFFDAEHFFDGYRYNKKYALKVLETACLAGAEKIILCDTNGGNMPGYISDVTKKVVEYISLLNKNIIVGIHCHNDSGLADACSLAAVKSGAVQVQGTINGIGERCGNANLCVVIPNLQLKLNYNCVPEENLKNLTRLARYISDVSNLTFDEKMPYAGGHAFTHKAGMHIDGVFKLPESFEHIRPELTGNTRTTLISEFAGRSALLNILNKINKNNKLIITKDSEILENVLGLIKSREKDGYQFENAEGSLSLLLLKSLNRNREFFSVEKFNLLLSEPEKNSKKTGALIKIKVDGTEEITADEGDGPVNALDKALRKALTRFYPELSDMRLIDYKVRVLNSNEATAAKVRVLIESADNSRTWRTVGVNTDIIEASWNALLDSVEYKLSLNAGLL